MFDGLQRLNIGFFTDGPAFDGDTPTQRALGGSETALVQAARALAERGHKVSVFNHVPQPGIFDDVSYFPVRDFVCMSLTLNFDVFIVSRFFGFFHLPLPARLKVLWNHDTLDRPQALREMLDRIDLLLNLSHFHRDDYLTRIPELDGRIFVTRNGVDFDFIDQAIVGVTKDVNKVIYASRPERGLKILLTNIWPRLVSARPDLRLYLCGYDVARDDLAPGLEKLYREIDELIEGSSNVVRLGSLPKNVYYRHLAEASLMAYPCIFPEISCIAALEAQACRTPVLTTDAYALRETVQEPAMKIGGRPGTPDYDDRFVNAALEFLDDADRAASLSDDARDAVFTRYNWPAIVTEWERLFRLRLHSEYGGTGATRTPGMTPIREHNAALLSSGHPAIWPLSQGDLPDHVAVEASESGPLTMIYGTPSGRISLHSRFDPIGEAEKMASRLSFDSGTSLLVIMGFGLGYHVRAALDRKPAGMPAVVVEADSEVFRCALAHMDLEGLLDHEDLHLLVGMDGPSTLKALAEIRVRQNAAGVTLMLHPPSLRIHSDYYNPLREALGPPQEMSRSRVFNRRRLSKDSLDMAILDTGYFLVQEIVRAAERLGHNVHRIPVPERWTIPGERLKSVMDSINSLRPDFLLTINHLGFDSEGLMAGFLTRMRLPFASWFVDSPILILGASPENVTEFCSIFLWDSDYTSNIKALGYEHIHFLPLATDETIFKPGNGAINPLQSWACGLGFVGTSMVEAVWDKQVQLGLDGQVLSLVDQAAERFIDSPDLTPIRILRELGLLERPELQAMGKEEFKDLEGLVIWRATQLYRLNVVQALGPLKPTIVGDEKWSDLLGADDFVIRESLSYYDELPRFYPVCRVNLNCTSRQMKTGVNQRVFDVPACGGFLLTDDQAQLAELFEVGHEVICYRNAEEALNLARYYLDHEHARTDVSSAARRCVLARHTYVHRMEALIRRMREDHR